MILEAKFPVNGAQLPTESSVYLRPAGDTTSTWLHTFPGFTQNEIYNSFQLVLSAAIPGLYIQF